MKTITYEFADGHIENIEVEDDVAEVFAEIEKYEKKSQSQRNTAAGFFE